MTTVVQGKSDSGTGFFMGIVLLIIAVVLFIVFGLPLINNSSGERSTTTTINMPAPDPVTPAK